MAARSFIGDLFGVIVAIIALSIMLAGAYLFSNSKQIASTSSSIGFTSTIQPSNASYAYVKAGQQIANFQVQVVNPTNVTGLLYMWYPVASANGDPRTLYIGSMIGYGCDGSEAVLIRILDNTAVFKINIVAATHQCPI